MKNKLFSKLLPVFLISLSALACSPTHKTYKVEWKLDESTVLEIDTVREGELPVYDGETPSKTPTNEIMYVFNGWDPEVVPATQDASYIATFKEETRKYEIKWANYDDTILKVDYLPYGAPLTYTGEVPIREDSNHKHYVFSGWDFNGDTEVTKDATYYATYEEVPFTYTVTWKSEGEVIELDENVEYGSLPSYDGATPTKATTQEKIYYFNGWDKPVSFVEADITYNAIYRDVDNVWDHYPATTPGVTTKGSKEHWILVADENEIVFTKPTLGTINEKEAPTTDVINSWESDDVRLIPALLTGEYLTLGSYPTNKITDETLYTSLANQLTNTAPTSASDGWKAYKHWFNWNGSKAVAMSDAFFQDIIFEGAKYRAVYFNTPLAKRCDQTYSSSNQYQQTNGYNIDTLYFFDYQPLKWTVVEEGDSHFTLLSSRVLDGVCFTHDGAASYVGAYNDLRLFTEGDFFSWAFSSEEQKYFTEITFKNDKSSGNNTDAADLTKKLSIPSYKEIETYFTTADARKKTTTDYAKLNGVQVNEAGQVYYWTRSRSSGNPFRVGHGGNFDSLATGHFCSAGILPQIYLYK